MKYYKCISDDYFYYKKDQIYPEDYIPGNIWYHSIKTMIRTTRHYFIEVSEQEYNKQEGIMDKKIIGYKTPINLFDNRIKAGTLFIKGTSNPRAETLYWPKDSNVDSIPKEIAETWEPVFAINIKEDDYFYIIKQIESISPVGELIKITKIDNDKNKTFNWINYTNSKGDKGGFRLEAYLDHFRIATKDEINRMRHPQITINGYKAEFFGNYVKFGCDKIAKELILDIYRVIEVHSTRYKKIESVAIGNGVFTKNQIEEIAEFYKNKPE
jgi:hypothetical protein